MTHRVFVDSNVLASRTIRDWLFQIRLQSTMFQLHSSPDAIIEAQRAWRKRNPKADGALTQRLGVLLAANLDEVLGDFPGDVEFDGKDVDDTHIHAAAVHSQANILLSDNGRDFGDAELLPYDIYTSDEFLCLADDSASHHVLNVTRAQALYWQAKKDAGRATKSLDQALVDAHCPNFAERVKKHVIKLTGV